MRQNLERSLTEIFGHEGGLSTRPDDPGNWTGGKVGKGELKGTKYGISALAYPHLDIPNLSFTRAAQIYRADYWAPVGADELPAGVDLAVFDAAVNSGVSRALSWWRATRSADPIATIQRLCAKRLGFLQGLSTWPTLGKGWAARIARIEATAVAWATAALGADPQARPAEEAAKAEKGLQRPREAIHRGRRRRRRLGRRRHDVTPLP
jgi:lysozyme family protein